MKARIIKIGNSQGIRIPKPMLEESGISEEVDLILQKKQLVIRAVENPREGWEKAFASNMLPSKDLYYLNINLSKTNGMKRNGNGSQAF